MASRRKLFHPSTWGVGCISLVTVSTYLICLIAHIGINRFLQRAMANEGLAFWAASGTVIAAVIASVYGSSYAFELNRQKDIDAQRKVNLEAGRWTLVVLAAHLTFIARTAKLVDSEKTSEHWPVLMRSIHSFDNPPELKLESIRFLLKDGGAKATNYLIVAASDYSVESVKNTIALRNGLRDLLMPKVDELIRKRGEGLSDEMDKDLIEDLSYDLLDENGRLEQTVREAVGDGRTYELARLATQLEENCETGIKSVYDLSSSLRELLQVEFPEEKFEPIDTKAMWKDLGRQLW